MIAKLAHVTTLCALVVISNAACSSNDDGAGNGDMTDNMSDQDNSSNANTNNNSNAGDDKDGGQNNNDNQSGNDQQNSNQNQNDNIVIIPECSELNALFVTYEPDSAVPVCDSPQTRDLSVMLQGDFSYPLALEVRSLECDTCDLHPAQQDGRTITIRSGTDIEVLEFATCVNTGNNNYRIFYEFTLIDDCGIELGSATRIINCCVPDTTFCDQQCE